MNSWPSLRIIDPEGNLVAVHSGEIEFTALDGFFKSVLPFYAANKLLDEKPLKFDLEAAKAAKTPLRFPGKVLADEKSQRLFVSDSNHNRIVISSLSGQVTDIIGTGVAGRTDGNYTTAQFDHPQGMALNGETLYVADTENHMLRKIDLRAKTVSTISGNGEQSRNGWPGIDDDASPFNPLAKIPDRFVGKPKTTGLNSPWDLWIHDKYLYIAMAGFHQIWRMDLAETEIGPYAGNGREHITDGELLPPRPYDKKYSAFAQPSGLSSDGKSLFVADSEGSAVRAVPLEGDPASKVSTLVGTPDVPAALFNFGDIDGPLKNARMQHCLGVAFHGGKVYVSDTYNNKVKAIDLAAQKSPRSPAAISRGSRMATKHNSMNQLGSASPAASSTSPTRTTTCSHARSENESSCDADIHRPRPPHTAEGCNAASDRGQEANLPQANARRTQGSRRQASAWRSDTRCEANASRRLENQSPRPDGILRRVELQGRPNRSHGAERDGEERRRQGIFLDSPQDLRH